MIIDLRILKRDTGKGTLSHVWQKLCVPEEQYGRAPEDLEPEWRDIDIIVEEPKVTLEREMPLEPGQLL